jgi:hypothetical protein
MLQLCTSPESTLQSLNNILADDNLLLIAPTTGNAFTYKFIPSELLPEVCEDSRAVAALLAESLEAWNVSRTEIIDRQKGNIFARMQASAESFEKAAREFATQPAATSGPSKESAETVSSIPVRGLCILLLNRNSQNFANRRCVSWGLPSDERRIWEEAIPVLATDEVEYGAEYANMNIANQLSWNQRQRGINQNITFVTTGQSDFLRDMPGSLSPETDGLSFFWKSGVLTMTC